jgi:phage portal protein BeeE
MSLRTTLSRWLARSDPRISFDDWLSYWSLGGTGYPFMSGGTVGEKQEEPAASFEGYVQAAYKSNGIIFACMLARLMVFSEARFQFRQLRQGRPGQLFGTQELEILERPWPNGTTGDLLTRAIQDADLAGNFYAARRVLPGRGPQLRRMRPDWVTIVLGSDQEPDTPEAELDAEIVGYVFQPRGRGSTIKPLALLPEQVAHFAPIPDPSARFRGMSWLTPIIRELMADQAATTHKLRFFENAAVPNLAVSLADGTTQEQFDTFVQRMQAGHEGSWNAYKTLFLAGGAKVEVVGADMKQLDFKVTQGAGETRIAAAAGVPSIIVGLSEGLAAATYSNYGQARRHFADGTMRHLWREIAGAFASILTVPPGAELWYDDRDIAFLQEDQKDAADILQVLASAIRTLVDAGFEPQSVVDAITAGDLAQLSHTELFSVQLHPPGTTIPQSQNGIAPSQAQAAKALEALKELARGTG